MKKILAFINKNIKYIEIIVGIACIVMSIILINMMYQTYIADVLAAKEYKELESSLDEYTKLVKEVQAVYNANDINEGEFDIDNAIGSYIAGLDDKYASYKSPESNEKYELNNEGKNCGIGVRLSYNSKSGYIVGHVFKNSGADKSGIQEKDIIVEAQGVNYKDSNYTDFMSLLRGEVGDIINIKILRGTEELEFDIVASIYDIDYVSYEIINNIPYIKVDSFTLVTDEQFIEIMKQLEDKYDKYIIDLRYNTGGFAESSANMVDYLVGEGVITYLKNKRGDIMEEYKSDAHEVNGKFVIITNEYTASASEMFTQSLIDYGKAVTVGTKTYGKGTTLTEKTLSNGGLFTYSSGIYYTKSGKELEGNGIEPDYLVEFPEDFDLTFYELTLDTDIQLQKALEILGE